MNTIVNDLPALEGNSTNASLTLPKGAIHKKMKYRSRFEIASTILEIARGGNSTKTRLMYGSFLSFAQINEYLNFLLANSLITRSEETHVYGLTEKGLHFMHIYDEIAKLVPLSEPIPAV
jgi:predicted transcriptional regulator